jgi:hypothetical protein
VLLDLLLHRVLKVQLDLQDQQDLKVLRVIKA